MNSYRKREEKDHFFHLSF